MMLPHRQHPHRGPINGTGLGTSPNTFTSTPTPVELTPTFRTSLPLGPRAIGSAKGPNRRCTGLITKAPKLCVLARASSALPSGERGVTSMVPWASSGTPWMLLTSATSVSALGGNSTILEALPEVAITDGRARSRIVSRIGVLSGPLMIGGSLPPWDYSSGPSEADIASSMPSSSWSRKRSVSSRVSSQVALPWTMALASSRSKFNFLARKAIDWILESPCSRRNRTMDSVPAPDS